MIKKIVFFGTLLFVYSCQNKQIANSTSAEDSLLSVTVDSTEQLVPSHEEIIDQKKEIQFITGDILLPNVAYRIGTANEIGEILQAGTCLQLYKDKSGYKISAAEYTIANEAEEPCAGMPTQTVETKRNTLVFLKMPSLKEGNIDTVAFKSKVLAPNTSFDFIANNQSYRVEAKGTDPLKHEFRNTPNAYYQLTLKTNGTSTLLLHQTSYTDTNTEILFIGDLDQDGKVDFILSSPRDYEEQRIIIILSGNGKYYEETRQFDC